MGWIMGNQSRPQEDDGGMSRKGMQVGKDGRVKGLSGIMEQQHLSTPPSRCGTEEGGEDGEMDSGSEGGYRTMGE